MNKTYYPFNKNERGFLILMVAIALFGLFTIFSSFVMPMIFAVVIVCASYPVYEYLLLKTKNSTISSGIVVFLMAFIIIFPITYVISELSSIIYNFYQHNQEKILDANVEKIDEIKNKILSYLPISIESQIYLSQEITKNSIYIFSESKSILINGSKTILDSSMSVLYFIFLTLFSMFFFYKGGKKIAKKIKAITPLEDDFDDLIMRELYSLCGVLTVSVFSISIIQGISFGIVVFFMDLNWFFIGMAVCITSFIPVVGIVFVWVPLSLYLVSIGRVNEAILVVFWGKVVGGVVIDNVLRPYITSKVSSYYKNNSDGLDIENFNPLDNIFLVVLSNLGGVLIFGVIGLFLGPIIVSISIAILDLYILRVKYSEQKNDFNNFGKNYSLTLDQLEPK